MHSYLEILCSKDALYIVEQKIVQAIFISKWKQSSMDAITVIVNIG